MRKNVLIIVLVTMLAALAFIGNRMTIEASEKTTFPQNSLINMADCSGMTLEQAIEKVTISSRNNTFYLINDDKTYASLTDLHLKYDLEDEMKWAMTVCNLKERIFSENRVKKQTVDLKPVGAKAYLIKELSKSPICTDESIVQTENAYVEMESRRFNIVPEIYGTSPDKKRIAEDMIIAINQGKWSMEYVPEEYYEIPTITKESPEILDRQSYCRKHLAHTITYVIGKDRITLSPTQMDHMLKRETKTKVVPRNKVIKAFVKEMAKEYDTINKDRKFESTAKGLVVVEAGTFGYKIDKKAEAKKLAKNLIEGKDVKRGPVYSSKGSTRGMNDFGDTYVEVDLQNQHFWYYLDGKVLVDDDLVSGCVKDEHHTVTGAFYVQYKARDVKLKGREDDGTKYESKVKYWMPFYYDYGLHDADWRGYFGGDIYLTSGSHGCVNLPPSAAEVMFENIYPGCPVIVF